MTPLKIRKQEIHEDQRCFIVVNCFQLLSAVLALASAKPEAGYSYSPPSSSYGAPSGGGGSGGFGSSGIGGGFGGGKSCGPHLTLMDMEAPALWRRSCNYHNHRLPNTSTYSRAC